MEKKQVKDLTFEQAMQELEEIAKKLEQGDSPLNEAIDWYERGSQLKNHCEQLLKKARLRFDRVSFDGEGKATLESAD